VGHRHGLSIKRPLAGGQRFFWFRT
jgi:hypothetical protein